MPLCEVISESRRRLRLYEEPRHPGLSGPFDKRIRGLDACRHRATRDISLACRTHRAHLDARHRTAFEAHPLDAPACPGLDFAPPPRLQERSGRGSLVELSIP